MHTAAPPPGPKSAPPSGPWPVAAPGPAARPRAGAAHAARSTSAAALQPRQGLPLNAPLRAPQQARLAPPPLAVWPDAALLDRLLGLSRRQGRPATLLLVELQPADPDTAAALLQAVGLRLRSRVRAHDEVALTADGALAVLLRDVGELASQQVRTRLEALLRSPYRVHADLVQPLLRIGRAVAGLDGHRGADLLRTAALPVRD